MADKAIKSDVFKFVALRPPASIEKKNQETNFISDKRPMEETPVGRLVNTFDPKDGTKIPEQVQKFIRDNNYSLDYPAANGDLALGKIYDFAITFFGGGFSHDVLVDGIQQLLDSDITTYLNKPETKTLLHNLWDRYYTFYILSRTENLNLDELTKNLRVLHLLQYTVKSKVDDYNTLQKLLSAKPMVSKILTDLPKPLPKTEPPQEQERPDPERIKQYKKIWTDIVDMHRALEEVKTIKFDSTQTSETKNITAPNKQTGLEEKSKSTLVRTNIAVNKKSFDDLHERTKSILKPFNMAESNFQLVEPVAQLQQKLEKLYQSAYDIQDPQFLSLMPMEAKTISSLSSIAGKIVNMYKPLPAYFPPTNIRSSIKPLGIGDLKVVKQKLKKYVAGEVAHIENVLRGEYKERKHRVLDRTEEILTVENETSEETTKDTQTTDRFELKKESEKTVQEQMSVQAGVTVSGSYGMVTFGAHGEFAYSTASQESNKSSSNFAREVIDKSVSKIQKRTKEERTTKKMHEVEEINTHGLDNKDKSDHAVGVYRWVDKYYEAQIYNYGKRMMLEFIIPEPAAFYEYAQTHKPKKNIVPPPIPYKWVPDAKGNWVRDGLITHKDINEGNYQHFIRDYNVHGITPPPLPYKTISTSIAKDGMPLDGNTHAVSIKELIVPAGYISKVGVWWDMSAIWSHYSIIEVTIGNKIFRPLEIFRADASFDKRLAMGNNHDRNDIAYHWFWPENPIQVSVNSYDVLSFTINLYALVERTWEAYEQWQIQTFEKIMAAYKAMQIEYEQKMAAQETMQGIAIQGQNPGINREIEETELKKQCVKMLMDTYLFGSFDAMKNDGSNPFPDFDIFDAHNEGKTIQFFEQAFEWENLTYLFYPYFWARKNQWVHKSSIYDTDPLFTKFLQAGSARVVLPVHPAYNDAIMYFLENNGNIWKGGEPPRLNDPLFISLADELKDQTDDLANAKPEGEPWEVVLPTTLVYLQDDSVLPDFTA